MHPISLQKNHDELKHANRRLLSRYTDWASYMLTVTFEGFGHSYTPTEDQVRMQIRHLQCCLNSHIWKNRTKREPKARILAIPVIEGARTSTRIHAHILLGNVKSKEHVHEFMLGYIPKARYLAKRYDIRDVYEHDGLSWYLSKETGTVNPDAIAWEIASIHPALLPK
jgi:hypothetical protein